MSELRGWLYAFHEYHCTGGNPETVERLEVESSTLDLGPFDLGIRSFLFHARGCSVTAAHTSCVGEVNPEPLPDSKVRPRWFMAGFRYGLAALSRDTKAMGRLDYYQIQPLVDFRSLCLRSFLDGLAMALGRSGYWNTRPWWPGN